MKLAVDAAVAATPAAGLSVREPRLLRDLTNVIVHLDPAAVVARVPLTFTRVRDRSWIESELRTVGALAAAGATVAEPAPGVDADRTRATASWSRSGSTSSTTASRLWTGELPARRCG